MRRSWSRRRGPFVVLAATVAALMSPPLFAQSAGPTVSPAPRASSPPPEAPLGVEPTRLFIAPTARSVPRGRGSFGLGEALFPWVDVGLTSRVSLQGVGVVPFGDEMGGGLILAPKLQVLRRDRIQAAVGVFHGFGSGGTGGLGYGVISVGPAETSFTLGYGYGYGGGTEDGGSPGVLFLGVEKSLGRRCRLMAEGYVGGEALGLPDKTLIGGARLNFGRWSLEVGVLIPFYETGSGTPFPIVSVGRAY